MCTRYCERSFNLASTTECLQVMALASHMWNSDNLQGTEFYNNRTKYVKTALRAWKQVFF